MRNDMDRVIITHPRHGDKDSKRRRTLRKQGDLEDAPKQERMRPSSIEFSGWDGPKYENLGEYLAPLQRYITSQIGKHWDKVYAEIRGTIDPGNAVQAHILQHLFGYIETKCYWKDGDLYTSNYYGNIGSSGGSWQPMLVGPGTLYVCPKSGIIRKMKAKHYQPHKVEPLVIKKDGHRYEKLEGIWYETTRRKATESEQLVMRIRRPIGKPQHPGYPVDETWHYRNRQTVLSSKRQLNSRDLKRLGIKNN